MSKTFGLNHLSVDGQCYEIQDALKIISDVVNCLKILNDALLAGRVKLFSDLSIQQRSLISGQTLSSTISKIPKNSSVEADVKSLWYRYISRAEIAEDHEHLNVNISQAGNLVNVSSLRNDYLKNDVCWISFGGNDFWSSGQLNVDCESVNLTVRNAYNKNTLMDLLPIYEPNPKHRLEPYFDTVRQEYVSEMALTDTQAQQLLLLAVEDGSDLISYCKRTNSYYRYKLTHGNIYHGFKVQVREISAVALGKLHN